MIASICGFIAKSTGTMLCGALALIAIVMAAIILVVSILNGSL